jgi:hypothetical protein
MIAWEWLRRCLIATALLIAGLLSHEAMFGDGAETAGRQPPAIRGH